MTTNLIGNTYGRLTVISLSEKRISANRCWECSCECGAKVIIQGDSLISGRTRSCGCYQKERVNSHGLYYHPLYKIYHDAKLKCKNLGNKYYGGKGIELKFKDIKDFKAWNDTFPLEEQWKPGVRLNRIDKNGHFEPGNLTWVEIRKLKNG